MRADRLVATLLLLQARGRVTAAEVAIELEISERTARRDLEALSMAGIPVYSQAGRGGGWSLLGGARTDLSGLTAAEARTLFLVAGPQSAATPEAKSALRKLVQALPETFRADAEAAAAAVIIDASTWGGEAFEAPAHLGDIQGAILDQTKVALGYADREGARSERTVSPLGLVQKGRVWYLVANTEKGLRTFRVERVVSVDHTTEPADRPVGFDLTEAWARIVAEITDKQHAPGVWALINVEVLTTFRYHWAHRLEVAEALTSDGRVAVTISGDWPSIVDQLAGYGAAVEVTAPADARDRLAQVGAELVAVYQ